jgi:hypothetical protein
MNSPHVKGGCCLILQAIRFFQVQRLCCVSFLTLFIFVQYYSCKNHGVEPPEVKDPRTYSWTVDTLGDGTYQSEALKLWGSSPQDVYAVGHSSSLFVGKIWHFDGVGWSDITPQYVEAFPAQQIFYFETAAVYGFGKNDVWIVGGRDTSSTVTYGPEGFAMHYTASGWRGFKLPAPSHLLTVWGVSSSDLWAGGFDGCLFHFNGAGWQRFSLNDSLHVIQIQGLSSTDIYLSGWITNVPNIPDRILYYHWDGLRWSLIESRYITDASPGFYVTFTISDGYLMSFSGSSITKRLGQGSWQEVFNASGVYFGAVRAVSSTNIFASGVLSAGGPSVLHHFNGKDWYRFPQFYDSNIALGTGNRMWSDGKEAFLSGLELSSGGGWPRSFIFHGK